MLSTGPNGSLKRISKVSGPVATTSSANDIMVWPATIRAAQRLIEAAASAPSTGLPSWKRSPSRSVNVQSRPSSLRS